MKAKRIVIKVGTSTLTYENGKLNLKRVESLCRVICDLNNSGKEVVLVSSGAIGVGVGKLGMKSRPNETKLKQALAAVGQCELMFMYDKFFGEYNQNIAQILLTKYVLDHKSTKNNVINTFNTIIDMGIIPIVNENDTVSVDELDGIHFGDNDTLSAIVAKLVSADLLIILTDVDGLYDEDPRKNPNANKISEVKEINEEIKRIAEGTGSNRGTGGMQTKISAAEIAIDAGIDCCIMSGDSPDDLYKLFEEDRPGTIFRANKEK